VPEPEDTPYDRIASDWDAARTSFRPGEETLFEAFVPLLPAGAKVLDLGCGTGRPNAAYLTKAGLSVHGVDASQALLDCAKTHAPSASYELADLRRYVIPADLDGVVAWDSLFHLRREEQSDIFERLAAVLPTGAPFLFTSGGSDQGAFSDTMWEVTFDYDAHPPEHLPDELRQAGFEVLQSTLLEKPEGGRNKGRLAVLARRA